MMTMGRIVIVVMVLLLCSCYSRRLASLPPDPENVSYTPDITNAVATPGGPDEDPVGNQGAQSNASSGNSSPTISRSTPAANGLPALPWCEVMMTRATAADCATANEDRERRSWGEAALDADQQMTVGQTYTVTAVIVRAPSRATSGDTPNANALLASPPEAVGMTRITREMVARLSGDGFQVVTVDGDSRNVADTGEARWQWHVTPTQAGRHRLTATLLAVVQQPNQEPSRSHVRTLQMDVTVNVTAMQSAEAVRTWTTILRDIGLALAGLIGAAGAVWLAMKKLRPTR